MKKLYFSRALFTLVLIASAQPAQAATAKEWWKKHKGAVIKAAAAATVVAAGVYAYKKGTNLSPKLRASGIVANLLIIKNESGKPEANNAQKQLSNQINGFLNSINNDKEKATALILETINSKYPSLPGEDKDALMGIFAVMQF